VCVGALAFDENGTECMRLGCAYTHGSGAWWEDSTNSALYGNTTTSANSTGNGTGNGTRRRQQAANNATNASDNASSSNANSSPDARSSIRDCTPLPYTVNCSTPSNGTVACPLGCGSSDGFTNCSQALQVPALHSNSELLYTFRI
jgi:hypothetical protein